MRYQHCTNNLRRRSSSRSAPSHAGAVGARLPERLNPPARLALAYRAMGKYEEALAASDRALAKAYGPRKIGILRTRADLYTSRDDKDAARRTMEEAIHYAESLT